MRIIIIAAIAKNGVIGRTDKQMPWHVSEDFKHFKNTTFGFPIIMGRKTFESLGKPLRGRLNIVITKNVNWRCGFEEVLIFNSLKEAIKYCEEKSFEKIFITGGGELYNQAIFFADEMILSYMNFEAEGQIYFPEFDKSQWKVVSEEKREEFGILNFVRK